MDTQIDLRADISPDATIGNNVTIGPFTIVEAGAVIGDGSSIGGNALIASGARIGRDCKIHHGAVIGHVPQDLKYANEPSTCEIGDRTTVREYATIHRGTGEGGRTIIGTDCFLMGYIHIAHDCVLGDRVIIANGAMMAGHTEIGDVVTIGGLTAIHQFSRIGDHAMVGGGLRLQKDVPPYILAGGEPLSFEGLNSIGLRRRGFQREVLEALDRTYELIYRSRLNVSQALAKIEPDTALMAFPEVRSVVEFIRNSKRGIVPAPRRLYR
jgi:UDP-N-acetylglucosamine acyltransferase